MEHPCAFFAICWLNYEWGIGQSVPMTWRALNTFIYLQSHIIQKPPTIIKSLKIRFNIFILKHMLPSAKFFVEYYDLCQGNGDRRNKSVHLFMPTVGNKVSISQHNSVDIILKYPPPTWSRISYLQKIFIPSCKQNYIDSLFQTINHNI